MLLELFESGPVATNAIVLACSQTSAACIIDPAYESFQSIPSYIEKHSLNVTTIILTHSHWDHLADLSKFKEKYNVPIQVHPADLNNVIKPGADGLPLLFPIPGVQVDSFFNEGDTLSIGNLKLQVIHTPGHTPGGVCFYIPEHQTLISGDTLFQGSIGNLSFPTADPEAMWVSLDKLAKLPPATKVYPGHGPSTTIAAESWLANAKQIFGD